jgi:hypothetical protein|tara:strand:+ start:681 stop:1523 length:843 start_codon:yes stop_codon:yes gene_type:complete
MAQPSTRQGLIDYCLRKLGAPVLEINVADEQIDDAVDDAFQLFHERHFDGVARTFLKYQLTADDVSRGRAGGEGGAGITTTTTSTTIAGATVNFDWYENSNFLQLPDSVIGIEKLYKFDSANVSNGMFSVKYQLFLNDIAFNLGYDGLLSYAMTKSYLEDIGFLLTTDKQLRFNKRQNRLYMDIDWGSAVAGDYIVLDCYRIMDPNDFSNVYNDSFVKLYLTALLKKQWGQNLIKFKGAKLPGGIELNGREIYEDAEKELEVIKEKMMLEYEIPPLDLIG